MRANRFWQISTPYGGLLSDVPFSAHTVSCHNGGKTGITGMPGRWRPPSLLWSWWYVIESCRLPERFQRNGPLPRCLQWIGAILLTVAVGILLNILISNTPLADLSVGYQEANSTLFSGGLLIKIVGNALLIPMLEEVVYREIVCGQLLQVVRPVEGGVLFCLFVWHHAL